MGVFSPDCLLCSKSGTRLLECYKFLLGLVCFYNISKGTKNCHMRLNSNLIVQSVLVYILGFNSYSISYPSQRMDRVSVFDHFEQESRLQLFLSVSDCCSEICYSDHVSFYIIVSPGWPTIHLR